MRQGPFSVSFNMELVKNSFSFFFHFGTSVSTQISQLKQLNIDAEYLIERNEHIQSTIFFAVFRLYENRLAT